MPQAPGNPVELASHYYRDNFLLLLAAVKRQYGDILEPAEQGFVDTFGQLGFDAQCLYVRLVSRVGPWFRESRLSYPELGHIGHALDELLHCGMVMVASGLSLPELDRLYTRVELSRVLGGGKGSKTSLLEQLAGSELSPADHLHMLRELDDSRVVAACGTETVELLQLLFFGNRYQGLTDFVLSDLGVARYYPYELDRSRRLFPNRQALDEYLFIAQLGDCYHEIEEAGEEGALAELARELLPFKPQFTTSHKRWHRLCNSVARQLERQGQDELALNLYEISAAHPARERRARLLEKAGDWRAGLALCDEILATPWCEEERDAVQRIRPRLVRKIHGGKLARRRDDFATTQLSLVNRELPVELLVAEHLCSHWAGVHYVENNLMNALFGLAFWEQIFAPIPGAFNNPYQAVPSDMYEAGFTLRRRGNLDARMAQLHELSLARELPEAYRRYRDYQCRWVNWRHIDEQLVEAACNIIPAAHLLAIWERILFDPRENRRGFPDLLALGREPGEYRMIEVKGPGDALQDSQKRWLHFFRDHGIPAEVAWVSWHDE